MARGVSAGGAAAASVDGSAKRGVIAAASKKLYENDTAAKKWRNRGLAAKEAHVSATDGASEKRGISVISAIGVGVAYESIENK